MRKLQWYTLSAMFLFFMLFFSLWARNRKNICVNDLSIIYDFCMQRYQILVALAFVASIVTIVLFILGLFEKR